MTAEKTPPVSEGWPTPEEIATVFAELGNGHGRERRICATAAWAVEKRPLLEELLRVEGKEVEDWCHDSFFRYRELQRSTVTFLTKLRAILTKEPQ